MSWPASGSTWHTPQGQFEGGNLNQVGHGTRELSENKLGLVAPTSSLSWNQLLEHR